MVVMEPYLFTTFRLVYEIDFLPDNMLCRSFPAYTGAIILSILCLILIYVTVSRECNEIFISGDDCGVGYGWSGLAGGFIVIGAVSAWKVWRLVKERTRGVMEERWQILRNTIT